MTKVTDMDVMESIRAKTLSELDKIEDVPVISEHLLEFWISEYPEKVKRLFKKGRLVEALMFVCKQADDALEEFSMASPPDLRSADEVWEDET
ncbi:MAG: hypothetical protein D6732_08400 [Methanobacteriota archaeon]|nr:MAG: hypothetical protein D6732_08400 [Euryarchaeota archaeon]